MPRDPLGDRPRDLDIGVLDVGRIDRQLLVAEPALVGGRHVVLDRQRTALARAV